MRQLISAMLVCSWVQLAAAAGPIIVDNATVTDALKRNVIVWDVRPVGDYARGHIPGAIFVNLAHDLAGERTGTNGRHPLPSPEVKAPTASPTLHRGVRGNRIGTNDMPHLLM